MYFMVPFYQPKMFKFYWILSHFCHILYLFRVEIMYENPKLCIVHNAKRNFARFICIFTYKNVSKCEIAFKIAVLSLLLFVPDVLCTLQQSGFLVWKNAIDDLIQQLLLNAAQTGPGRDADPDQILSVYFHRGKGEA